MAAVLATTKRVAITMGLTEYHPNRPCLHGHHAPRLVSNYSCKDCNNVNKPRGSRNDYLREWRKRTWEKRIAVDRAYKERNRVRLNQWFREWAKKNPERKRAINVAHRAAQVSAYSSVTPEHITALRKRQRGRCYWCNEKLAAWHLDHVVPLARGGAHRPENVVLACKTCNLRKGVRSVQEFAGRLL